MSAGLDYFDALATTTSCAGKFVQSHVDPTARIGLIEYGLEADLIVVRHNPLDDIRLLEEIVGAMTDGVWFSRDHLQRMME